VAVGTRVGVGVRVGVDVGVSVAVGLGVKVGVAVGACAVCVAKMLAATCVDVASSWACDGLQPGRTAQISNEIKAIRVLVFISVSPFPW